MLTVLIVDDEPLARENLRGLLQTDPQIAVIGECANAIDAIGAIHRQRPDVVFLDIQMPRISGLEMVGMIDPQAMPYIVFLTAFDEYAVRAFEEHAFDYLLKPVEAQRLNKTLQRLHHDRPPQSLSALKESECLLKYIPCSGHSRIYLLPIEEILYVSSGVGGISAVRHDGLEGVTDLTLRTLEARTLLLRCHRQYLVNMAHLREIRFDDNGQTELHLSNGKTIPVSRRYLKTLKEQLGINH
ncbi:two-component system response regulator BtsR [Ewingella americana]|jgi:two-component system LytT family response regulator